MSCVEVFVFARHAFSTVCFFSGAYNKTFTTQKMQTRKRTISDLPWFCQNLVFEWLPDYKAMRSLVVAQIREEDYYLTNNHRLSRTWKVELARLQVELDDYYRALAYDALTDFDYYYEEPEATDYDVHIVELQQLLAREWTNLHHARMMGLHARGVDIGWYAY
jgi:hypothetical protein